MVKGECDQVYKRLYSEFSMLVEKYSTNKDEIQANDIYCVETTKIIDFEQSHGVVLIYKKGNHGNRYMEFTLKGKKQVASIKKNVRSVSKKNKRFLSISLCRSASGRQFWLIHYSEGCKNKVRQKLQHVHYNDNFEKKTDFEYKKSTNCQNQIEQQTNALTTSANNKVRNNGEVLYAAGTEDNVGSKLIYSIFLRLIKKMYDIIISWFKKRKK